MKIKSLTLLCSLMVLSTLLFISFSSGPANVGGLTVTAAPGENGGFCGNSGCHSSGAFNQESTIEVIDSAGLKITEYEPGVKYEVNVIINAASGNPAGYGFQMVALKDQDDSSFDGWDLTNSQGISTVSLMNRTYVEHNNPKVDTNFFRMEWLAPPANTGSISFYAATNAANLNGSNSGDGADTVKLTLNEALISSTVDFELQALTNFQLYPNPASSSIQLDFSEERDRYLQLIDSQGKVHLGRAFRSNREQIHIERLMSGIYFIRVVDLRSSYSTTHKFLKE